MALLRHRLRTWVSVWLVFQAATFSALMPRDCCAAHQEQHTKPRQIPTAAAHADHHGMHGMHGMHSMHGMNNDGPEQAPSRPDDTCVLRGTCQGPMSAIIALLSNQGAPPVDRFALAPDLDETALARTMLVHIKSRLAAPDPPPPRA